MLDESIDNLTQSGLARHKYHLSFEELLKVFTEEQAIVINKHINDYFVYQQTKENEMWSVAFKKEKPQGQCG